MAPKQKSNPKIKRSQYFMSANLYEYCLLIRYIDDYIPGISTCAHFSTLSIFLWRATSSPLTQLAGIWNISRIVRSKFNIWHESDIKPNFIDIELVSASCYWSLDPLLLRLLFEQRECSSRWCGRLGPAGGKVSE